MKKILLGVLLMCGVTVSSFAQGNWAVSYQGELNVGYAISGKLKNDAGEAIKTNFSRPFVETIHGVRIGDYLYAGVGVSVQYAYGNWVTGDDSIQFASYTSDLKWNTLNLPIFLNLKGYYPVSDDFQPYVSVSLGGSMILSSDLNVSASEEHRSPQQGGFHYYETVDLKHKGGFYYDFGLGFNYKKLNFGFGLMHQTMKIKGEYSEDWVSNSKYDYSESEQATWKVNSFYVKVGLKF